MFPNLILSMMGLVLGLCVAFFVVCFFLSYGRTLKRLDGIERFCLKHMNLENQIRRIGERIDDHERRLQN